MGPWSWSAEKDEERNPDGLYQNATIPTLLAHPKATKHIMEFLQHTEVGRRVDGSGARIQGR